VLYRKVLVAANLKPRKMAGVESNGMVFCASNDDHTIVRCVRSCALRPFARARFFFFSRRRRPCSAHTCLGYFAAMTVKRRNGAAALNKVAPLFLRPR
jgi:tRNA-binding EMAP/Myf-like protein